MREPQTREKLQVQDIYFFHPVRRRKIRSVKRHHWFSIAREKDIARKQILQLGRLIFASSFMAHFEHYLQDGPVRAPGL